ncbi:MAG: uroporphyrinogen decarboxylase [Flavobacteriales bacterium]
MSFSPAEIVGYIASLFVLVSFLMKDIKKLRLINSVGCMLFVVYGILLNFSIPIILTNTAILIINTIALLKKSS